MNPAQRLTLDPCYFYGIHLGTPCRKMAVVEVIVTRTAHESPTVAVAYRHHFGGGDDS